MLLSAVVVVDLPFAGRHGTTKVMERVGWLGCMEWACFKGPSTELRPKLFQMSLGAWAP